MPKIAPVRGTRDFYPPQMALRNWILDGWRNVSQRHGFLEYDGPIFEHLQLFTEKSGPAIAGELFSLTDRGGRELAIRPEMTPTLARMVNKHVNSLPKPIKWFSLSRCCRAERPQKGRLREFFQWNVDIVGSDSLLADAECIFTAVDYLRSVGLTSKDIVVRFSSRSLLAQLLRRFGFAPDQLDAVYTLLDKRPKMPADTFQALARDTIPDSSSREPLLSFLQAQDDLDPQTDPLDAARAAIQSATAAAASDPDPCQTEISQLIELRGYLQQLGVYDYCRFDLNIVRGLAYYTGVVFEIFDRSQSLRAVGGGGRYDNLLTGLGGPQISGTGFGMGDVVLEILLTEKKLLRAAPARLDCFVAVAAADLFETQLLPLVGELRRRDIATAFDYNISATLSRQLKQAAALNARWTVILARETLDEQEVTLKHMDRSLQFQVKLDEFRAQPAQVLDNLLARTE